MESDPHRRHWVFSEVWESESGWHCRETHWDQDRNQASFRPYWAVFPKLFSSGLKTLNVYSLVSQKERV